MKTLDNLTNINEVEKVVRDSLALDKNTEVKASTLLKGLGADDLDLTDMLFKLGINFQDYAGGEKLSEKGKERMLDIADAHLHYYNHSEYSDVIHFIKLSSARTINDFLDQLSVGDLIDLKNYDINEERIKYDVELNKPILA